MFGSEEQKKKNRRSKIILFLERRFSKTTFFGLPLTLSFFIFLFIILLFLGPIRDIIDSGFITKIDESAYRWLYELKNPVAIKVFMLVTLLGEEEVIITFAFIIFLLFWSKKKKFEVYGFFLALIGSEGLTFCAKLFFDRPRPVQAILLEHSSSFPSGHATISMAFYGFLAYIFFRQAQKKKYRLLIFGISIVIISTIGFSRLYLGVHYISDVLAGYLIGLLWLILGISVVEWKRCCKLE